MYKKFSRFLVEIYFLCAQMNKKSVSEQNINEKLIGDEKMIDKISLILVIIGAINWGSIGLFKFDIVGWIFGGQGAIVSRIIFTVVALAGIWCISMLFRDKGELEVGTTMDE